MALVRYQTNRVRLSIGVFLATALTATWCAGQYAQDNGFGNTPMAPAASSNISQPTPVPGPPTQPPATSRPSSWPGAAPQATPWQSPEGALPPANELTPCEGTRIIARVGSEVILEGDVMGPINDYMATKKDSIPPSQVEATREFLIKRQLKNLIQNKLIFLDAKQKIPSEAWPQIEKQMAQMFDESEMEKMMKQFGATSRSDLEQKLRKFGTSLERERRSFSERRLAQDWAGQQVKRGDESAFDHITQDQVATYYRQHLSEFTTPARAKWEELKVRSLKYPSEAAAYAAIAQMGNQVLAGAKFADVAKAGSDGATAPKGGEWSWTDKGALACQAIDKALFDPRLAVGQMSPIIKGTDGFHIIRVLNREEETVAPFVDAQVAIRKKIIQQRSEKQIREYLAKLEAKTPVTTIYDDQPSADDKTLTNRPRPELLR